MKIVKRGAVISLGDIRKNLFVRKELDQERVLEMADIIESNQKAIKQGGKPEINIPQIIVTPAYNIGADGMLEYIKDSNLFDNVDGRHRVEAYTLNSIEAIEATVVVFDTRAELIAYAYKANTGGSKPPTREDTEHVIRQLVEEKMGIHGIAEVLGLPFSIVRKYVDNVKSKVQRQKIVAAINDIADGKMTAAEAAKKQGIDEDKVREALSGRKRKTRKSEIGDLERELSNKYRSFTPTINAIFKQLHRKIEDADLSLNQALKIAAHVKKLQARALRHTDDWEARLRAIVANGKTEAKE